MMPTDKECAETWRRIADCYESLGGYPAKVASAHRRADELDQPKPTYPDGTIAWVTLVDLPMKKYLGVRVGDEWRDGYGPDDLRRRLCAPSVNVKVEPLRVLGDDEIAVKRVVPQHPARAWRESAERARMKGYNGTALLEDAYADALDAEAGDRS